MNINPDLHNLIGAVITAVAAWLIRLIERKKIAAKAHDMVSEVHAENQDLKNLINKLNERLLNSPTDNEA